MIERPKKYPFYVVNMTSTGLYYIKTVHGDTTALMDLHEVKKEVSALRSNGHDVDDDITKF